MTNADPVQARTDLWDLIKDVRFEKFTTRQGNTPASGMWISLALTVLPGVALTGCTEKIKPPTPGLVAPNSEPAAIPNTKVPGMAPAAPSRS